MQQEALIETLSPKGHGIAGKREIAHTVPGDRVSFEKRRLLDILTPSPNRIEPRCAHARTCGGCCWQQMNYPAQLQEKETRVKTLFETPTAPILASPELFGYRNKMEFTFSKGFLGMIIAQTSGYVFNLTECHLTSPWFAAVLNEVRTWWQSTDLQAYFGPADRGHLRYLTLREGKRTNQKMAILNVSGHPGITREHLAGFTTAVQKIAPDAAIFLRIHQTKKGSPTQFFEMHLAGADHITEQLHLQDRTLSFKISPISFFQPNTLAAEKLYDTALSFLPPCDTLLDLYCGTGTLGMAFSHKAKRVIGVELSAEAVLDAEVNLALNNITNMTVLQGDVGTLLPTLPRPDAVIVDPPRAGLDEKAISHLLTLLPEHIVYISCNPTTQAANIRVLSSHYDIKHLQPVDQFPHTYHIENIAYLVKKPAPLAH